jgi:hypothetical protein
MNLFEDGDFTPGKKEKQFKSQRQHESRKIRNGEKLEAVVQRLIVVIAIECGGLIIVQSSCAVRSPSK